MILLPKERRLWCEATQKFQGGEMLSLKWDIVFIEVTDSISSFTKKGGWCEAPKSVREREMQIYYEPQVG